LVEVLGHNIQKLALWAGPLIFIAVLFYWAMGKLLALGFQQDWLSILSDSYLLNIVFFTIWQALLSTLLCLVFGLPGAYLLYRKKIVARKFMRALVSVPFVLPTIVVAISLESYRQLFPGFPLIIIFIAHLFLNYSIVVKTVGGIWATLDFNLEKAAALDGANRWQIFLRITLPQLRPAIASACTLVFLYCVTSFGVILLLGAGRITSIETEIYFSLTEFLDFNTAASLSVIQTLITFLMFLISNRLGSAVAGVANVVDSGPGERLSRREWPVVAITLVFVGAVIVFPISQMFLEAFVFDGALSLVNFANLTGLGSRQVLNISVIEAALNSMRNIVISAGLAMVIGTLVSWLLTRTRSAFVELLFIMPIGVSSVALGFGYLISFGGGPLPLRSSWLVVPLIQALLATPVVIRMVHPALLALGLRYREAATTAGATDWQVWRFIEMPLISDVLRSALVYAALISVGEFGAAALLSSGDEVTLPVVLYQLISRPGAENYGMAMAASALIMLLVFAISMTTDLARKRRRSY
jgi:thiamine transport system permease protein